MNRRTSTIMGCIRDAEEKYREEMAVALDHYRKNNADIVRSAAAFKDEQGYINAHREPLAVETRSTIEKAGRKYAAELKKQAASLRSELNEALAQPLSPQFVNACAFIGKR